MKYCPRSELFDILPRPTRLRPARSDDIVVGNVFFYDGYATIVEGLGCGDSYTYDNCVVHLRDAEVEDV